MSKCQYKSIELSKISSTFKKILSKCGQGQDNVYTTCSLFISMC